MQCNLPSNQEKDIIYDIGVRILGAIKLLPNEKIKELAFSKEIYDKFLENIIKKVILDSKEILNNQVLSNVGNKIQGNKKFGKLVKFITKTELTEGEIENLTNQFIKKFKNSGCIHRLIFSENYLTSEEKKNMLNLRWVSKDAKEHLEKKSNKSLSNF